MFHYLPLPGLRSSNLLFDDPFFDILSRGTSPKIESKFSPRANVIEQDNEYLIEVEVPGLKRDEIDIEVKNDTLTIQGERTNTTKNKENGYSHIESAYGSFKRSWIVTDADTDKITANFKDGILELKLPKKKEVIEKNTVKKIAVK